MQSSHNLQAVELMSISTVAIQAMMKRLLPRAVLMPADKSAVFHLSLRSMKIASVSLMKAIRVSLLLQRSAKDGLFVFELRNSATALPAYFFEDYALDISAAASTSIQLSQELLPRSIQHLIRRGTYHLRYQVQERG